jgi:multidrug efflux pump subunit AcrB
MFVRNKEGQMVPLGTLVTITPTVGPSLISLFNLYPTATIIGLPADGFSSGEVLTLMEEIARRTLAPRHRVRVELHVLSGEAGRPSDAGARLRGMARAAQDALLGGCAGGIACRTTPSRRRPSACDMINEPLATL